MRGNAYVIEGGRCHGNRPSPRWMYFGLLANRFPGARGFSVVVVPSKRPGRNKIIDSIVQLNGRNLAPTGYALVEKDFKTGTFSIVTKGPSPLKITGSWSCG